MGAIVRRSPFRVFNPVRIESHASTETVSELFTSVVLPQMEELKRARSTVGDCRCHVRRWGEFWLSDGSTRINHPRAPGEEPPAGELVREDLQSFRRWLAKKFPSLSNRTLNKHVQTIQSIVSAAAEAERISTTVSIKPLPHTKAASKLYLTIEQVDAIYRAADVAEWPQHWSGSLKPADFWRTCFVFWFNYGMRTQELYCYERDHTPLTVGQFLFQVESPAEDGTATNGHGWFYYTPQKQKRFKDKPLVLPLNAVVRAHVEAVLRSRSTHRHEPLLPAPRCNRSFYGAWNAILKAAGVRPKPKLDGTEREFEIRHLRKTAITYLNKHRRGIAPYIVGHADREDTVSEVSDVHYDNPELAVVEALNSFPQPPSFLEVFRKDQQLTLF